MKKVNSFDVGNIIAANRAFMRIGCTKFNGGYYYHNYVPTEMTLCVKEWPKLLEADYFFAGNDPVIEGGETLRMPLVTSLKGMYMGGTPNSVVKLEAPLLTCFDEGFKMTTWKRGTVDLNEYFSTLPKGLKSIRELMYMAHIVSTKSDEELECEVDLDLTGLSLGSDDVIDATSAFAWMRTNFNTANSYGLQWNLVLNLLFSHRIDLTKAFMGIMDKSQGNVKFTDTEGAEKQWGYYSRQWGFATMDLGSVFKEDRLQYIESIAQGMQYNTFSGELPLKRRPNDGCDDTEVYDSCTMETAEYDFSPNKVVVEGKGQFDNCTINGDVEFSDVEWLKEVEMKNVKLATPCVFPCLIHNTEAAYNDVEGYENYRKTLTLEGSEFTGVQDKALCCYWDWSAGQYTYHNPFVNCKNMDFKEGLDIYYNDIGGDAYRGGLPTWDFRGCTAMTVAPVVHLKCPVNNSRPTFMFNGLENLVTVDLSHVELTADSVWDSILLYFNNCTNLKYVYFTEYWKGMDFTGCRNLDAASFETEITKAISNRNNAKATLTIQQVIWEQLSETCQELCVSKFKTVNIINETNS